MTPTHRLSFNDEKSGHEVVLFIDRDVPLVVVHRNLARGGVSISKHKLKLLMEQAKPAEADFWRTFVPGNADPDDPGSVH